MYKILQLAKNKSTPIDGSLMGVVEGGGRRWQGAVGGGGQRRRERRWQKTEVVDNDRRHWASLDGGGRGEWMIGSGSGCYDGGGGGGGWNILCFVRRRRAV
jgi:hypothetical protein